MIGVLTIEHAWSRDYAASSVTAVLPPPGQRCGTVCLNSFGNRTSPLDNLKYRWKCLCLVSWAAAPCVWTLRAPTGNLLTYSLDDDGCVCSDTLLVLGHPKTTHVLCEQPSVVCLWTGVAHLVDQDELGFERLSSTSRSTISASTRRGSVRRTVQVAKTRGDGYVLSRTRHPMMMMMTGVTGLVVNIYVNCFGSKHFFNMTFACMYDEW